MENELIINIKDLYFKYDNNFVLENINFKLYKEDFVGIIGPNGGGKTTLIKLILGLLKPSKGKIEIFCKKTNSKCHNIGYVPQHMSFDFDFPITVWEIVILSKIRNKNIFKSYNNKDIEVAKWALNEVGMYEYKDRAIRDLSGGQRQKVLIARALSGNPQLLILDEATSNIDSASSMEFYHILEKIHKKNGYNIYIS